MQTQLMGFLEAHFPGSEFASDFLFPKTIKLYSKEAEKELHLNSKNIL